MLQNTFAIWEKGTYFSEGEDGFQPTLTTYILDGTQKRPAVLICPGGGYGLIFPRETEAVAVRFNSMGYHTFILNYSVAPRKHPQPLMDISRAMCIIREKAEIWNVSSSKIIVCGFSAGGHLAASLGVHWDKAYLKNIQGLTENQNRPDALVLCYPVISSGEFAHRGSFNNLLGESASSELVLEMSLEHQISKSTPPTFLWHTAEDKTVSVENSMLFASALRKNNIPFELHIYQKGPHGLSLASLETQPESPESPFSHTNPHAATWVNLCREWLDEIFLFN